MKIGTGDYSRERRHQMALWIQFLLYAQCMRKRRQTQHYEEPRWNMAAKVYAVPAGREGRNMETALPKNRIAEFMIIGELFRFLRKRNKDTHLATLFQRTVSHAR